MAKTDETDNPSVAGMKDDFDMVMPQIEERAPFYVYRLLCGAKVSEGIDEQSIQVRSCGQEFVISKKAYAIYDRIKNLVTSQVLELRGIRYPFNAEDVIRIFHSVKDIARTECAIDASKLRVYFLRMDEGGCGFYRVMQPVHFISKLCQTIYAEQADWINFPLGQKFDVIVAPRVGDPLTIGNLKNLKECGKIVLYECDDLLSKLPDWNPVKDQHTVSQQYREYFVKLCDGLLVSTEELRQEMRRPDVSHVCHNGINPDIWPMRVQPQSNDTVRILWAGSSTHEEDLKLIVPAVKRLISKFGKKVEFVFVNYAPNDLTVAMSFSGRLKTVINPAFKSNITLVPGCPVLQWPQHLSSLNCHIAIAPLVEHDFNRCKSEIKVLEAWAMGIPIVASAINPYSRAVTNGSDGILCAGNPDIWYNEIKRLIESPEDRLRLAENGLSTLKKRYLMSTLVEEYERALLTLARGKVARPECNEAIERRLAEKSWN